MNSFGVNKKFVLCCFLLGILFVGIYFINYYLFPQIKLSGGSKIVISYKEKYSDKYSASYMGKDITDDVVVKGNVDTNSIGTYHITYKVGSGIFSKSVVREVLVKDVKKPKIEIDKDDVYLCPGTKYKPVKVKATDDYDGDLSSKVKSEVFKDKVVYSVKDSSGNMRSVTKKLIYKDVTPPKIELVGSDVVTMCSNDAYKEPGYNVEDNCDGEVKGFVDGAVDNSVVGEYELSYNAVDKAGNKASVSRKVVVSEKDKPGVVYLTFDDGPNYGTTDVILDILKEEGVKATFFVTGFGPDELIKREYDEGHTVALHTNVHDYAKVYASDEAYYNDLQAIHDRVLNITGVDSKLIRFPGGSSNTVSRRYSSGIMSRLVVGVQERGYKYFDWNVSSGDAGGTTDPNMVYANVVNGLRHDRVNNVLMHDVKTHTRDALRSIIRYCKENGYEIRSLGNCSTMVTQRVNN